MYRIYFSTPTLEQVGYSDCSSLNLALQTAEQRRQQDYQMVSIVAFPSPDYVGKFGSAGAGTEYVPQMLN